MKPRYAWGLNIMFSSILPVTEDDRHVRNTGVKKRQQRIGNGSKQKNVSNIWIYTL